MKPVFYAITMVLLSTVAQARIGETESAIVQRFGSAQACTPPHAANGVVFPYRVCEYRAQGFNITICYGTSKDKRNGESASGRSLRESYAAPQNFSAAALSSLLASNKGNSAWSEQPSSYSDDGEIKNWSLRDGTKRAWLYRQGGQEILGFEWIDVASAPKGF